MATGDLWVFGYGSLIWRPGFDFEERQVARLAGWRRGFCMTSIHYRGTPEAPGLVLALDEAPEAACEGLAFRVAATQAGAVLAYLRERELVSSAYDERRLPVRLADGREVEAVAYVVDRAHAQYVGGLTLEQQAEVIGRAEGSSGPNLDYLLYTVEGLTALGVHDEELVRLASMVRQARAS
ncbi:MAG: gamma-glutamylcyclotransferase [Amaricoccus sp.]|uniref:gamma-glutamylcyclotransferase n=1 Tax=Amaricoccus sp. TaxID=1872485 RepID=UPI0039E66CAA